MKKHTWAAVFGFAITMAALGVCGAETQAIDARAASEFENWGYSSISGVKCMQTGAPGAELVFDIVVPEPGGTYKVSVPLVKAFDGGFLRVYIDNQLQTEVNTYAAENAPATIPVCDRFIASGKHTIKIKDAGQKTAVGGKYAYVLGLEIVGPNASGAWQIDRQTLTFTPLKQEDLAGRAKLLPTDLPPRLQKEPFSIPAGSDAADIFSYPVVSVNNIPFRIPKVSDVPETGFLIEEQKPLEVSLPGAAQEIFLLIWSKIPAVDGDAGPGNVPIAPINQSERFTAEIAYKDGTADQFIPYNVVRKRYGLDDGLSLYVIHAPPGRSPGKLIFHDKVYKCSFALVALTCNTGKSLCPDPGPGDISPWYPVVNKKFSTPAGKTVSRADGDSASISDGTIAAQFSLTNGLQWSRLGSPVGAVTLDKSPLFAVRQGDAWIGSDKWKVVGTKASGKTVSVNLAYSDGNLDLRGLVKLSLAGNGKIKVGLTLANAGGKSVMARVRFPIMEGLKLGSLPDTWYFIPKSGAAMINRSETAVYGCHGSEHPLQVDSFFNPKESYALTMLSNDLEGQFHWYDVGKSEEGGWYRLEYLEKLLKPGATWSFPDCIIAVSLGDWRTSFRLYRDWVNTWYKPKPTAQDWYTRSFVQGFWYQYTGRDFATDAKQIRDVFGYCDGLDCYFWNAWRDYPKVTPSYSGEYDKTALWPSFGGEKGFKAGVKEGLDAGAPVSFYTDAILINDKALYNGVPTKRAAWTSNEDYDDLPGLPAYRPCLSIKEWTDYMVDCERWLTRDIGAKIVYLDEFGYNDRICYRKDHPHDSPYPSFYGERELTKEIRAAVPADVAICTENEPEDTRFQLQNGYYGPGIRTGFTKEITIPMNMTRFAFPDTKCFNLLYGYSLKDNNWELLKFVLFNGDAYALSRSYDPKTWFDKHSIEVLRKIFRILHENADAFTSFNVEPLMSTEMPGVFVNRFKGEKETVWTVFNANYRTVKGKLLEVPAKPGSRYVDMWNDRPVSARVSGKTALLTVEIGPRDIACISQSRGIR